MIDQISIIVNKTRVKEGNALPVTVYCVDREGETTDTPDSIDYRVDCLTTGTLPRDWTAVALGPSSSFQIESSDMAIVNRGDRTERKQITVRANRDEVTQVSDSVVVIVRNQGFNP